ncbi:hypothetical protein MHTCC0001_06430 [Flavobacteriaceae bacterium MHTCC 0001]
MVECLNNFLTLSNNHAPKIKVIVFFYLIIIILPNGKLKKPKMEQEKSEIIELCKTFAKKADELENKAFNDRTYRENGFAEDFNKLFNQHCYGKQNRTVSGLNFRKPARYSNLAFSNNEIIEEISKTRFQVTFVKEPEVGSIRFIIDKKKGNWRIIRFETYLGIANHGKTKGEEIWRRHKL